MEIRLAKGDYIILSILMQTRDVNRMPVHISLHFITDIIFFFFSQRLSSPNCKYIYLILLQTVALTSQNRVYYNKNEKISQSIQGKISIFMNNIMLMIIRL
jgi:hypothetical protein